MDSAKNGRWIISFKKFGLIRVKQLYQDVIAQFVGNITVIVWMFECFL